MKFLFGSRKLKKDAKKKTKKAKKNLRQGAETSVQKLGALATNVAIANAPIRTGLTVSLITGRKTAPQQFTVTSHNSTPGRPLFNLPVWMATSRNAPRHIKTGEARYMNMAAMAAQRAAADEVRVSMNTLFK